MIKKSLRTSYMKNVQINPLQVSISSFAATPHPPFFLSCRLAILHLHVLKFSDVSHENPDGFVEEGKKKKPTHECAVILIFTNLDMQTLVKQLRVNASWQWK